MATSHIDMLAAGTFLLGGVSLWLYRKRPSGPAAGLFVLGTSVGLGVLAFRHLWPEAGSLNRAGDVTCLLSLFWALVAGSHAVDKQPTLFRSGRFSSSHGPIISMSKAMVFCARALGFAALIIVSVLLLIATHPRLIYPNFPAQTLGPSGLLIFTGLCLASMLISIATVRERQSNHRDDSGIEPSGDLVRQYRPPAEILALAGMGVWWTSLMIPTVPIYGEIPKHVLLPWQSYWWTWSLHLQMGLAMVVFLAALIQDVHYRSHRSGAWPEKMNDLIRPYSRWPGYVQTEALLAAVVLLLGIYQLVHDSRPGWASQMINALASVMAGATCLFVTYRRWSPNTAGLGTALLTLGCVAAACALAMPFVAKLDSIEYAVRMPVLFNAELFALWIMIRLWNWLSRFWDQQLLDGNPWTTAGRMIPYARRTALLLTAIAVLIAIQMTLWPIRSISPYDDDSVPRILFGSAAILLLAMQCTVQARRTESTPQAALAVAFYLTASIFVFIRLPSSPLRGWLIQYDPVVLSAVALPILLIAEALRRTRWRCFSVPMWFLALLILPLRALLELLSPRRMPAEWVQPITLALLGALYSFFGRSKHRRAFLVLGGVLLFAATYGLYRLYQSHKLITIP